MVNLKCLGPDDALSDMDSESRPMMHCLTWIVSHDQ